MHSVPLITLTSVLHLVTTSTKLQHLDIYDNGNISAEGVEILTVVGRERNITIVLKDLTDEQVAPANPCGLFLGFGKSSS